MVLRPGVNYIIYNEFSKIQVQGENKSSWPMFTNWRKRGKMSKQTELYDSKWWLVLNSSQKGKFSRVTFQPQVWRLALHISTNGNHDPMTQKYQATPGTLLSPANICVSIFKKCSFLGFFFLFLLFNFECSLSVSAMKSTETNWNWLLRYCIFSIFVRMLWWKRGKSVLSEQHYYMFSSYLFS